MNISAVALGSASYSTCGMFFPPDTHTARQLHCIHGNHITFRLLFACLYTRIITVYMFVYCMQVCINYLLYIFKKKGNRKLKQSRSAQVHVLKAQNSPNTHSKTGTMQSQAWTHLSRACVCMKRGMGKMRRETGVYLLPKSELHDLSQLSNIQYTATRLPTCTPTHNRNVCSNNGGRECQPSDNGASWRAAL